MEVPAPQAGTIEALLVGDGEKVVAKQKLYTLRLGGEPSSAPAPPEAPTSPPPAPSQPRMEEPPVARKVG